MIENKFYKIKSSKYIVWHFTKNVFFTLCCIRSQIPLLLSYELFTLNVSCIRLNVCQNIISLNVFNLIKLGVANVKYNSFFSVYKILFWVARYCSSGLRWDILVTQFPKCTPLRGMVNQFPFVYTIAKCQYLHRSLLATPERVLVSHLD